LPMRRIAVFAYGSLVDPASAGRTLGREMPAPLPARLHGWTRRWTLLRDNLRSEKTFAIEPGGQIPPWVLGLNIQRVDEPADEDGEGAPNGGLLELTEAELERLDLREIRFDRVDVTGAVPEADGFDVVVAYTAKPSHYTPEPPSGAVVLATYIRAVEAAFAALGDGEWDTFLRTTPVPPVETVEPVLVRDQIPPGNPRGW
jgi:hypothetical protein